MRRFILFLAVFLGGIGLITGVLAAEQTIKSEYQLTPQYPWTKNFKVKLLLYPTADVQRIEVRWSRSDILSITPTTKVLKTNGTKSPYVVSFKITPRRKGQILLHASIVYYSGVSTYVDSIDIPLEFNDYLRLPPGPNYTTYLVIFYVGIFVLSLLLVFGLYKLVNFVIYEYLPKWFASKTNQPI